MKKYIIVLISFLVIASLVFSGFSSETNSAKYSLHNNELLTINNKMADKEECFNIYVSKCLTSNLIDLNLKKYRNFAIKISKSEMIHRLNKIHSNINNEPISKNNKNIKLFIIKLAKKNHLCYLTTNHKKSFITYNIINYRKNMCDLKKISTNDNLNITLSHLKFFGLLKTTNISSIKDKNKIESNNIITYKILNNIIYCFNNNSISYFKLFTINYYTASSFDFFFLIKQKRTSGKFVINILMNNNRMFN